jgi:hypothetical protein
MYKEYKFDIATGIRNSTNAVLRKVYKEQKKRPTNVASLSLFPISLSLKLNEKNKILKKR